MDKNVKLEFRFTSNDQGTTYSDWYIDDVTVTTSRIPSTSRIHPSPPVIGFPKGAGFLFASPAASRTYPQNRVHREDREKRRKWQPPCRQASALARPHG